MAGNLDFVKSNETNLGKWIRLGLKDVNRNQVWLAEKVGVQPPQISRIISGASEATPDLLSSIADALGKPRIHAYRAAGYLDPQPPEDEWAEQTTHKLRKLSPGLRSVADRMIEGLLKEEETNERTKPKTRSAKA